MSVYSGLIHSCQKLETTQTSIISLGMDKQSEVHSADGIHLRNKMETWMRVTP